jgi:hypothetical protein
MGFALALAVRVGIILQIQNYEGKDGKIDFDCNRCVCVQ